MKFVRNEMARPIVVILALVFAAFSPLALSAPAQQLVVAKSGGNYTTISAALAAIAPSATKPYVIDVMPGTYTENIVMKSYVHLRGAGREVVTVSSASSTQGAFGVVIVGLTNVQVSGLTLKGPGLTNVSGINIDSATSISLRDSRVTQYGAAVIVGSSSPIISGNSFVNNLTMAIRLTSGSPQIVDNMMSDNGGGAIYMNLNCAPLISGNVISRNGGASGHANISVGNYSNLVVSG